MEYIMSGKQCLKPGHDQLNKWKCSNFAQKLGCGRKVKESHKGALGLEIEHVCSPYRGEAVFEEEGLEGEVEFGHRKMIGKGMK